MQTGFAHPARACIWWFDFMQDEIEKLVTGSGGAGSANAASLVAESVASLSLFDTNSASSAGLASRLKRYYPNLEDGITNTDPAGYDLVVNGAPLGMKPDEWLDSLTGVGTYSSNPSGKLGAS